jgi:hypothetical protein
MNLFGNPARFPFTLWNHWIYTSVLQSIFVKISHVKHNYNWMKRKFLIINHPWKNKKWKDAIDVYEWVCQWTGILQGSQIIMFQIELENSLLIILLYYCIFSCSIQSCITISL